MWKFTLIFYILNPTLLFKKVQIIYNTHGILVNLTSLYVVPTYSSISCWSILFVRCWVQHPLAYGPALKILGPLAMYWLSWMLDTAVISDRPASHLLATFLTRLRASGLNSSAMSHKNEPWANLPWSKGKRTSRYNRNRSSVVKNDS